MRRPVVVLLLGALMSAAAVWFAGPAQACDCSTGTTVENAERADAVFIGRLVARETGVRPPQAEQWSSPPALFVFEVDSVIKGRVQQRQEILSPWSGANCGLELQPGNVQLAVFASRSAELGSRPFAELEPDQYSSFLCDGNAALTPTLSAELAALPGVGPPGPPMEVPAAAPLPRSAPSDAWDGRTGAVLAVVAGLAATGAAALVVRHRRRASG